MLNKWFDLYPCHNTGIRLDHVTLTEGADVPPLFCGYHFVVQTPWSIVLHMTADGAGALIGDPRAPRLVFFIDIFGRSAPSLSRARDPRSSQSEAHPPPSLDKSK